jgi:hypothetical protein
MFWAQFRQNTYDKLSETPEEANKVCNIHSGVSESMLQATARFRKIPKRQNTIATYLRELSKASRSTTAQKRGKLTIKT